MDRGESFFRVHRRTLSAGALAVVATVASGVYAATAIGRTGALSFPLDDAYIHMQIARNFADGYGWAFNRGEVTAGSTAPLWTLLLAVLYKASGHLVPAALIAGVALHWLNGCLVASIVGWLSRRSTVGILSGGIYLLTYPLVWGSLSGMESPLYMFLFLSGLYLHVRYRETASARCYVGTVCFALAATARPELMMMLPVILFDLLIAHRGRDAKGRRRLAAALVGHGLVFLAVVCPYVAWNYLVGGHPFPTTFYAKVGDRGLLAAVSRMDVRLIIWAGIITPLDWLAQAFAAVAKYNLPILLFTGLGVAQLALAAMRGGRRASLLPALVLFVLPMALGAFTPANTLTIDWQRRSHYVVAGFIVLGSMGVGALAQLGWQTGRLLALAAGIAAILWGAYSYILALPSYVGAAECIFTAQVEPAQWAAQNLPDDAVIAAGDIGAAGFYSQRRIVDLGGLLSLERQSMSADDYLAQQRPSYLLVWRGSYPAVDAQEQVFRPIYSVALRPEVAAFCPGPRAETIIYEAKWPTAAGLD